MTFANGSTRTATKFVASVLGGPSIKDVGTFFRFFDNPLHHVNSFLLLSIGKFQWKMTPIPYPTLPFPLPPKLPTSFMDGTLQHAGYPWSCLLPLWFVSSSVTMGPKNLWSSIKNFDALVASKCITYLTFHSETEWQIQIIENT